MLFLVCERVYCISASISVPQFQNDTFPFLALHKPKLVGVLNQTMIAQHYNFHHSQYDNEKTEEEEEERNSKILLLFYHFLVLQLFQWPLQSFSPPSFHLSLTLSRFHCHIHFMDDFSEMNRKQLLYKQLQHSEGIRFNRKPSDFKLENQISNCRAFDLRFLKPSDAVIEYIYEMLSIDALL